jgi:hypothetical protein
MADLCYPAILKNDVDTMNRVLHDKLFHVHSSGDRHARTTYIAALTDGAWDYQRIERSGQTIAFQGPWLWCSTSCLSA